jgi:hypothetical protein
MLAVDEGVPEAKKVMVIVLVQLGVELYSLVRRRIKTEHGKEQVGIPSPRQKPPSYSG